jgi:hypothetical protein
MTRKGHRKELVDAPPLPEDVARRLWGKRSGVVVKPLKKEGEP